MTETRRYGDDEVAEIFEDASAQPPKRARARSVEGGLTLPELQAIGQEVGIPPERIAEAAGALDTRGRPTRRRTLMGLPVGVGHSVDLPRRPTEREWAMLVAELRETFSAQGKDVSRGEIHGWRNGNLHAYVEPTEGGYRLRMGTLKGDARAANRAGVFLGLFAAMLLVLMIVTGKPVEDFAVAAILGGMGVAAFGYNALRLPPWAREREEQMEHIAARARRLIGEDWNHGAAVDTL